MDRSDVGGHIFDAGARLSVDRAASSADVTLGWIVLVCVGLMVVALVVSLARWFSPAMATVTAGGRRRGPRG